MARDHKREAAEALRAVRREVRWKPDKDSAHLQKRKAMGHLGASVTLDDYNGIIRALVSQDNHAVYLYPFGSRDYYAVSGEEEARPWLVLFAGDGTMETAFPPDDMVEYLAKRGFRFLGTVGEIDDE